MLPPAANLAWATAYTIRMSQIALLSTGCGMAVAIIGGVAGFVLSALVGNGIAAVATPASSQLLGRWAVRRYAPFAFSVTQTAIPVGILLGVDTIPDMFRTATHVTADMAAATVLARYEPVDA